MSKLGIKIITSYIVMVIVSTCIFMFTIKITIKDTILYEKNMSINIVMDEIINNIEKFISLKNFNSDTNTKVKVLGLGSTHKYYIKQRSNKIGQDNVDAIEIPEYIFSNDLEEYNIYIYNKKGRLSYIFTSDKNIYGNYTKLNLDNYFVKDKPIIISNKEVGRIVVSVKDKHFKSIDTMAFNSVYDGFFITILVSLIMALIFEMSIVGPISKIRSNIKRISLSDKIFWESINTKDELEEINKELLFMTTKLRTANKNQKEFFQNTSHELKTPLMSIQGYAEAIKDGVLEEKDLQQALDIIIDESKNLSDTITSVLYLSSIDKNDRYLKKEIIELNLYEEVEKMKEMFEFQLIDKKIILINNLDKKMIIKTRTDKVERVIKNLFINALRYAESKIIFDFLIEEEHIHFFVKDDGKGFEEDEIYKIFDRFYKGDGGKTGLGLSIVSAIVKNEDGKVNAYNSQDGGAVIEIILPNNGKINY